MPFVNKEEFLKPNGLTINDGRFKPTHGHTSSKTGKVVMSRTYNSWNKVKDTEWADRFFLPRYIVYCRIKAGWSTERTLLTPVDLRFSHKGKQDAVCK